MLMLSVAKRSDYCQGVLQAERQYDLITYFLGATSSHKIRG